MSRHSLLTATNENSKKQFYFQMSNMVVDPATSQKAYWSILETFLKQKVSSFLPIYHYKNDIIDLKEKTQIFNNFNS